MEAIVNKNWFIRLNITVAMLFGTFLFVACEEIVEVIIIESIECILKVMPKLPDKQLADGKIWNNYFESIQASAINSSNDDSWEYRFVITGNLPSGIEYGIDNRTIFLSGQPTKKGVFKFKVNVSIGSGFVENEDGVCFSGDSTEKTCSITIH
jgi:hypothetical protein